MNQNICFNCGGNLIERKGRTVCAYCGTYMPKNISNEETILLTSASQKLRLADFSEAEQEFDDLIRRHPNNAYGYWGRLLARYCIKYEEDYDGKRIPTCYAASIESVCESSDYKKAIDYADEENRAVFSGHAAYIERVRKEWVEKAIKEPYDIFISYKDSDSENGLARTDDSFAMQELYFHLKERGYRVFFSRESLRDKEGEKYEPYIYNALSTAKIMLVYGSRPEYIRATWVKNEWTRYLKHMREGKKKQGSLLVVYKGFNPSELPGVLSSLQSFDAGSQLFSTHLFSRIEALLEDTPSTKEQEKTGAKSAKETEIIPAIKSSEGLAYKIDSLNKNCTITGIGICNDSNLVIPEILDGYWVNGIGDHAFKGCNKLLSVLIPNTVKIIGCHAFSDCEELTDVTIPDSVTTIGYGAFRGCIKLSDVSLPASVSSIGYNAFGGVGEIAISKGNKRYLSVDGTLYDINRKELLHHAVNKKERFFRIPDGVEQICENAFRGCDSLICVDIPSTVTAIGVGAFQDCFKLENVTVPDSVVSIEKRAFSSCHKLKRISIPSSVRKIGEGAFSDCRNLEKAEIPDSVTSLENELFFGCSVLSDVAIPASVTDVRCGVFENCTSLASVEFPTSVTEISDRVFAGCIRLSSVVVPASVTRIRAQAFQGCASLSTLQYMGTKKQWKKIELMDGWNREASIQSVKCKTGAIKLNH